MQNNKKITENVQINKKFGLAILSESLDKMAHSTGHPDRLERSGGNCYGDADYAREELVAELTAALCGAMLGFATTPREENAAYLKGWLEELQKAPTYLFDILTDVNRAVRMISERLEDAEPMIGEETPAEAA